jgi:hypothetical protein
MRVYIIGKENVTVSFDRPNVVGKGERIVTTLEELQAARFGSNRLLALWNAVPGTEKLTEVTDREAIIAQLWSAIEALPDPEPEGKRSKQSDVIGLLRRPEGATVDEVMTLTGWQRHTVRGVFSGALKKKLGLTISSAKEDRGRVYRIVTSRCPPEGTSAATGSQYPIAPAEGLPSNA